jgi:hypothetical protein
LDADALARRAASLRSLGAQTRALLDDIDDLVARAPEASARLRASPGDALTVAGAGALLHAFYNELERIFDGIARTIDGIEPTGPDWHARLADLMFVEVPSLRPAVLPESLRAPTREHRAFRHLFRHLYVLDLEPARVAALLGAIEGYWSAARSAIEAFVVTLERVADGLARGTGAASAS